MIRFILNNMSEENKLICPKCGGDKVVELKSKSSVVETMGIDGSYQEPTFQDYECKDCGELFNL